MRSAVQDRRDVDELASQGVALSRMRFPIVRSDPYEAGAGRSFGLQQQAAHAKLRGEFGKRLRKVHST